MGVDNLTDRHEPGRMFNTSVSRSFTFEASHQLTWHTGKCAKLHGHSYRLEVTVASPLKPDGVVIDFGDIKATVTKHVLTEYDHAHLNDFLPNPTAELVAADIAERLLGAGLQVSAVTVHETAACSATVHVRDT
ncbi:6-carboxytetrahydropterin synthase [Nocardioides sp.]|uniref:6-pyruvoyl trahydropterin synthase family protein n=1 Tax=Nocardioides sp. TaxID=35761 RepID=UPI002625C800|nr:6-carboxytetrahydropterin synthase [Nocardioides sp.]